jgi:hypothetical protein
MTNLLKTAVLSALIGIGAIGAVSPAAAQSGVYLGLGGGHSGPSVGVWLGDSGHSYRRHDRWDRDGRWDRDDRRWEHRRGCSAEQALDKAERMGLRRARIVDIDRRSIDVRGRKYGERVMVSFARAPGCPVRYY